MAVIKGTVSVAPDIETLVPIATVKTWLRVLHNFEDGVIELIRDASITEAEEFCKTALLQATYIANIEVTDGRFLTIEGWELSIDSIEQKIGLDYLDITAECSVTKNGLSTNIVLPEACECRITYKIGYSELPKTIHMAILLISATRYMKREDGVFALPTAAHKLLNYHKIFRI